MAVDAGTFTVYSAIGNREDLSDVIYRIDPTDTPFVAGIERVKAKAVTHEWQTQALAAVNSTNRWDEGFDAVTDAATPTVRLGNNVQLSAKVARVTGTQRSVEHAGRGDELEYQEMLKGLELRRDIETIMLANQAKSTGAYSTAPNSALGRTLGAVLSWIYTNQSLATNSVGATAPNGASARIDAATPRAFTEAQMKTVLQSIWNNGGKPDVVMVGGFNKQQFSTFTGRSSPIEEASSRKIVAAVDAYESDFGRIKVVPNRFQRARDVLILQMDMWAKASIRDMVSIPLAKTGDSDRRMVLTEYSLEARNEKASGGVFDVTSA